MEVVIILLIIAGCAVLTASFLIKDKPDLDKADKEKIADEIRSMTMSDDSMDKIMKEASSRFSDRINSMADDKLSETTDKMGQTANEKMMAINDMADQLVEKIDENHKEVVFLYDMLNEKSDNIKDYSSRLEGMKRQIDSETKMLQTLSQSIDERAAVVRANQSMNEARMMNNIPDPVIAAPASEEQDAAPQDKKKGPLTGIEAAAAATKKKAAVKKTKPAEPAPVIAKSEVVTDISSDEEPQRPVKPEQSIPAAKEENKSMKDRILELSREGLSVMDISKTLQIGQGEVKLVLGLYGKRG